MINVIKHHTVGDALISALDIKYPTVEIIDHWQSGRAVVERVKFYTLRKAKNYIERQLKFDHWNKYEIVYE